MYMHSMRARALHKRTSVGTPRRAAERLVAAAAAMAAAPWTPAIVPLPSLATAATSERPERVGEGTG